MRPFMLASLALVISATEARAVADADDDDAAEAGRDAAPEVPVAAGVPWTGFYFNADLPAAHQLLISDGKVVVIEGSSIHSTSARRRGKSIELSEGFFVLNPPRRRGGPWTLTVTPFGPEAVAWARKAGVPIDAEMPTLTQIVDPFLARLSIGLRGAHRFARVDADGTRTADTVTVTDAFAVSIETDRNGVRSCHAGTLSYDPMQDALTPALQKQLHPARNDADAQAMRRRIFAAMKKPPQPRPGKGATRGFEFSSRDTADCRSPPSSIDTLGMSGRAILFADSRGAPLAVRLRADLGEGFRIDEELYVAEGHSLADVRPLLERREPTRR